MLKQKGYPLFLALLPMFFLLACEDESDEIGSTGIAYVRVMDIQHGINYTSGNTNLSVFEFDRMYFGDKNLDTIKSPAFQLPMFGDFVLGRARKRFTTQYFREEMYLYTGGLDYYKNQGLANLFENDPNRDFYIKSGLDDGRAVYFPNLTHRAKLGTIKNGIDYYKWAQFPSGSHRVGFRKVKTVRDPYAYYKMFISDSLFAEQEQYFKPGGLYTLILANEDKKNTSFKLMTIEENAGINFSPTKSYVRFINAIEVKDNPREDVNSQSIDIYLKKVNNKDLKDFWSKGLKFVPGDEKLITSDLKRFQTQKHLEYIEMDFSDFLTKGDTSQIAEANNFSYIFLVYPNGQSKLTNSPPLVGYTQLFTNVKNIESLECENYIAPLIRNLDKYHPTITTVFVGANKLYYNLEQTGIRQAYLDSKTIN